MKRLYAAAAQLDPPVRGQSALARALGQSPQTVKNWESRATGVSAAGAHKAQQELGVSSTWVLSAEEPMFVAGAPASVATIATAGDYVRVQQLDAEAGMGGAVENADYPEVIRAIDFEPGYIRSIIGFVPAPGRLRLITGTGDSMQPVIQPGDTVVVDTAVTFFDGDGLYLINMGNGQQIKRLLDRGLVYVASENKSYGDPFPVPEGTVIGGKVYLRNRIERFN
ncbi:S24 family peptidase [Stenotrophomonas bentonitica]|uniref:LexA family transcriptional regulator n=1 Tax=Stenotrophomonas bentonitica TaxID=1450134 RepID=UPI000C9AD8CC|nr:helix-turn-helix transcriptional regulator [Stenotrophomonas bentonitica]